jgi:FMN-dependent NADH-azoreductase
METAVKLLHIDSSILGAGSASRQLTSEIVSRWRSDYPGLEVRYTDLSVQELPHFSSKSLAAQPNEERARDAATLADFLAADVIVIGAPMYNFSIPSQLKAWIDRVTVAGKTFRYTEAGPQGLAGGKKVIVAISRGGVYAPNAPGEFAESYLKFLFAFLGIDSVTFVRAEGLALSPEHRRTGINSALAAIGGIAPRQGQAQDGPAHDGPAHQGPAISRAA